MTRQAKPPRTSLTRHHKQYKATSLSLDNTMTCRSLPLVRLLSMALSKSRVTISACTPSMTLKPTPMPHCPLQMWPSYLSSGTPKWVWYHLKNWTSSCLLDPQPHINRTPACHCPTSTIDQGCPPLSLLKSQVSYWEITGSTTSRGSCQYIPTLSLDSAEGWWRPPFINTTSSLTTPNSSSHEGETAFNIHAHSGQEKTCTLKGSSHRRKLIPSTP
jgi:hypothetical protein